MNLMCLAKLSTWGGVVVMNEVYMVSLRCGGT